MKIRVRNRTKLFAFVIIATLLALFAILRATRDELYHPTIVDFDKIEFGMTESEVKAILGAPHKVLTWKSSNGEIPYELRIYGLNRTDEKVFVYYGAMNEENGFKRYDVTFDVNGDVCGYAAGGRATKRTVLERLMDWFKTCFEPSP